MIDKNFPLIDLHRHLDGNVRLQTILDLGKKHNLPLPAWKLDTLRPHVQVTEAQPGIMAFIDRFKWMTGILVDYDACRRIGYENMLDAQAEDIDYIELRFSPLFMAQAHGLDPVGIVEAVSDGVRQGESESGVKANLIGILSRHFGADSAVQELNALLEHSDKIVGLDLAGDEANFPGDLFVEHFRRARDAGWQVTVHAGEAAGAESIWQAIRGLGGVRIGHATRAMEDPTLVEYMVEHRIGIEANLTSNVQTSTVPSYADHPLKALLEAGVLATINTDDPGISNITLPYEYEVAAPRAGLSEGQILHAQKNALELAFLSSEEKQGLLNAKKTQLCSFVVAACVFSLTLYTSMRIIIAGGSGLIGCGLANNLASDEHEVIILSRTPEKVTGLPQGAVAVGWDARTPAGWRGLAEGSDVIVNFAGENLKGKGLFPKRWTNRRKALIRQSRLDAGNAVIEAITSAKHKPKLLIQASAVGFYGPHGDEKVTEESPFGSDFMAQLCRDWEASTAVVENLGVRRVILRTGLPLSLKDGAFPSLVLPFRLFVGNTYGSGNQFYPWIHLDDHITAIRFLIDEPKSSGPYNLSAPNPVTNREFARTLGKVMKRPVFLPVPRFALEIPFGEVATVVMDGQRALPTRLLEAGFQFRFPELEPAFQHIFGAKTK